jgi:hypothetical protein
MGQLGRWIGTLVVVGALLVPNAAHADQSITTLQAQEGDVDRPWAKGVPLAKQEAARTTFEEANSLLKDSIFKSAAQKYIDALKLWDHPGIHFNLALTLVSLEKPVEAYEHFKKAIAYGAAPIDEDKLERAKSYLSLLEQQLATVRVSCVEAGTVVRMDGQQLFVAPGQVELRVKIGDHLFSAVKPGFERTDISRMLKPKEVLDLPLKVYRAEDLVVYKKKFAGWVPWVPTISGVLVAGGGVALSLAAKSSFDQFDSDLAAPCADQGQCSPSPDSNGLLGQGETFQVLSIVAYAVGGTALATGLVMFSINQPKQFRLTPEERNAGVGGVAVVPWFTTSGGGLATSGKF